MPKLTKIVHNASTGEVLEIELNAKEIAQYEADQQAELKHLQIEAAQAAEKAELLSKLGITEDEAKLLLS